MAVIGLPPIGRPPAPRTGGAARITPLPTRAPTRGRARLTTRLLPRLVLLLAMATALEFGLAPLLSPPAVVPASAPATQFSAERAMAHLAVITAERVPLYVISGLLLGLRYAWRRSLYPNIVLHALLALMTLAG